jgi:tRNA modification GTPase
VVTVATALDGWPIELSDTAGLRAGDDPLEQAGVELARRRLADADCAVLVFDATARANDERRALVREYSEAIVACNKADLLSPAEAAANQATDIERPSHLTSAVTGHGVERLATAIIRRLIGAEPHPSEAVPFTPFQVAHLSAARDAVGRGELAKARAVIDELQQ